MTIKRKMFMDAVLIAPGIVVPVVRTESAMEAYRRQQFECSHAKRDPRGTCYHCGHRKQIVQSNCRACGSITSLGDYCIACKRFESRPEAARA